MLDVGGEGRLRFCRRRAGERAVAWRELRLWSALIDTRCGVSDPGRRRSTVTSVDVFGIHTSFGFYTQLEVVVYSESWVIEHCLFSYAFLLDRIATTD